jgi:hypothetical protein
MKINTFTTTDFQICVILSALGYKLATIDKSQPRFIFHFEDNPQIQTDISKFYSGELSLDPRLVLMHAKLVKDRIHGGGKS